MMRRIKSVDLPQADRLESVLLTVMAVGNGARTDIEIANRVPGIEGDSRQGRYYRKAAEMLGFILNERNNANLTESGSTLLQSQNLTINNPIFVSSVLSLEIYQKLFTYLEVHPNGRSRNEIIDYLQLISDPDIGPTMIGRRISTILSWPKTLRFIDKTEDNKYKLINSFDNNNPIFEVHDIDQPLLPTSADLSEYQEIERRTNKAREYVQYYKNQAKLDRAFSSHNDLVNLVANRIRENGGIPKSNQLIDLAVSLGDDYIFEMKSTNEDNVRSQMRKGLSQLYEYRYLQNKPQAKLILVVEKPLEASHSWMLDYMEIDRGINLVWDGNNQLYGSERAKSELNFLGLI